MHIVPTPKRLRQEGHKFKASLNYIMRLLLLKKKTEGKERTKPLTSLLPPQQTRAEQRRLGREQATHCALAFCFRQLFLTDLTFWAESVTVIVSSRRAALSKSFSGFLKVIFLHVQSDFSCFSQELLNILCLLEHKHLCKHRPHFFVLLNIAATIWVTFISAFDVALSLWKFPSCTGSLKNEPPQIAT